MELVTSVLLRVLFALRVRHLPGPSPIENHKRIPHSHQDIAADFFALRKAYTGSRWIFSEGRNSLNAASHCDLAWAAALATHAHTDSKYEEYWAILVD